MTEEARARLGGLFQRFAAAVERLMDDGAAMLSDPRVADLEEIVFLVRHAPPASRRSLEVVRVSMREIRKLRESRAKLA